MVQEPMLENLKLCLRCGPERGPISILEFHPHGTTKDRLQNECKSCRNERRREARKEKRGYYATERERGHDAHLLASRRLYYRYKAKVFAHYGGEHPACKCGFDDPRALSIDHVDGGGSQHRKTLKGISIHKWLVAQGYPEGFQILCMNCQYIKRWEENGYSEV
jgi:hypothetical protein